ncbi:hypothetical protein L1987_78382 [Smallanthus sonchifolius]|uniref:Uncharacterized protein n=1 Tax=Smallanthus sonchifolius TaxID=185202 RepID=A0ACB8ZDK5_9ASTR|nr:hypothetical protein L1987_78382 [Smallanthus sonchifolius]
MYYRERAKAILYSGLDTERPVFATVAFFYSFLSLKTKDEARMRIYAFLLLLLAEGLSMNLDLKNLRDSPPAGGHETAISRHITTYRALIPTRYAHVCHFVPQLFSPPGQDKLPLARNLFSFCSAPRNLSSTALRVLDAVEESVEVDEDVKELSISIR